MAKGGKKGVMLWCWYRMMGGEVGGGLKKGGTPQRAGGVGGGDWGLVH